MCNFPGKAERGFSLIEMAVVLAVISLIVAGIASGRSTLIKASNNKLYQRNVVSCLDGAMAGVPSADIQLDTGWLCEAAESSPDPQVSRTHVLTVTAPESVAVGNVALVADIGNKSLNRAFGDNKVTVDERVITIVLPVEHNLGGV